MNQPAENRGRDRFIIRAGFEELLSRLKKNWRTASVGALLSAIAGSALLTPLGDKLAQWSYDLPFRVRGVVYPTEAALVYMDEQSHQDLGQPYDRPWNRALHAQLLDLLTAEHVKGVVFDIVFSGPGADPKADEELASAIKKNGKVILAADYRTGGSGTAQAGSYLTFDSPYDPLYNAADGRLGSDFVYPDSDQSVRLHLPTDPKNDQVSSEGWTAATMLDAAVTRNVSNKFLPFYVNYYGPSGTIRNASFSKVLAGEVATNFFTDKIVFVGARLRTKYSGERKDEYQTPFSYVNPDTPFTGGVEIQATAFLNLLRNERIFRLPVQVEVPLIFLCGLLTGFGLTLLRPMGSSLAVLALAAGAAVVNYLMFAHLHRWFAWEIIVLAQLPIAWVFSISFNSVQLYVEKQKVEQSLSLYLSPKLVKKFASNPKLLKPGAEKQLLTILFSDIASFTNISEGMDSDDLARSMNDYFQIAVHNCIHATDGTVVKYIGDAIFAFWNAPELQSDHSFRACEAALRFRDQPPQFMNGKELVTRIGLHTGVANVGNFGSMTRVDYTALGENINLASRMEGLNKYLGTRVLITSDTQQVAGPKIITRYLGLFRLKGFEKAVGVHELTGRLEQEAESRDLRELFARALAALATRDFAAAEAAFHRVLELSPKDGPSLFYLHQIEELRHETLPADWKGEITLKEK
ncbi:MAG: CHASE2 domain-containing protein [Limisphaerales bacterium]